MSSDGLSLADRFKMALTEIGNMCGMARQETETTSNAWIREYWLETEDSVDAPDSLVNQVRHQSYDWLPESSQLEDERPLSQALLDAERALRKFDKALQLVCEYEDDDGDDTPASKKKTFEGARSGLVSILSELTIMREQLSLDPPDATADIESVETSFCEERPGARNDRYLWEYIIVKQLMEYLGSCDKLFKQLAARELDEQLAATEHDEL